MMDGFKDIKLTNHENISIAKCLLSWFYFILWNCCIIWRCYREKYVLFDDDSKTKFKEQSSMLIEQQQSHQWFGNLVTYSWWSHLWISEGFSRYFQYFIMDLVSWNICWNNIFTRAISFFKNILLFIFSLVSLKLSNIV